MPKEETALDRIVSAVADHEIPDDRPVAVSSDDILDAFENMPDESDNEDAVSLWNSAATETLADVIYPPAGRVREARKALQAPALKTKK